jgi:hypothetical protein
MLLVEVKGFFGKMKRKMVIKVKQRVTPNRDAFGNLVEEELTEYYDDDYDYEAERQRRELERKRNLYRYDGLKSADTLAGGVPTDPPIIPVTTNKSDRVNESGDTMNSAQEINDLPGDGIGKTNNDINGSNSRKPLVSDTFQQKIKRFGRLEVPSFWKPRREIGSSDWMTFNARGNWVWWVIGGYSVTVMAFRFADMLNSALVPQSWFDGERANIVNKMIAPEENDVAALLVGAIAPCLSAPIWEVRGHPTLMLNSGDL